MEERKQCRLDESNNVNIYSYFITIFWHFSAKDCIQEGTKNYKGKVSCTVSGRTCKQWDAWVPHLSAMMPHISEWGTNYCRALGNVQFPWCYTTDRAVRWEYCHVALC